MNPSTPGPDQEVTACDYTAPPVTESANLLQRRQGRFPQVVYNLKRVVFGVGDVLNLTPHQANWLLDGALTEQVIFGYRKQPEQVLPEHVRRALCRTSPWM